VAKSSKNGSAYIVRWSLRTGKEDKSFVSLQKAIEFAKGKARDLSLARDEGSSLTRDESQEYILAIKALSSINVPLRSAIEEYVKAKELVGSSLLSICEEWNKKQGSKVIRINVPELVDLFISAKNDAKARDLFLQV
jgi:hypothetical protein